MTDTQDSEFHGSYPHLAGKLFNSPLAIDPGKAQILAEVLNGYATGSQPVVSPELAARFSGSGSNRSFRITQGGTAIIPIIGSTVHRGAIMDAMSGITSYQSLGRKVIDATNDPDVSGILLEVDSPGGEVSGLFAFAHKLAAAAGEKKVWAMINEEAFSAAYAISVATSRIIMPVSGMTGSIGVIALHVDRSEKDRKQGYKYTAITAGDRKNDFSSHEPLSDSALNTMQGIVNANYQMFVEHVAENRGISEAAVRNTQAGIFTAQDAQDLGLVDALMSFDDTISELEESYNSSALSMRASARSTNGELSMSNKGSAPGAEDCPEVFTQAQLDAATSAARVEGNDEGHTAAILSERERIASILSGESAKGREEMSQHLAFKTDMSADEAIALLEKSPAVIAAGSDGKSQLGEFMEAIGNPPVGVDSDAGVDDLKSTVERIINS